jgi:multidrug efflux pump subunit AcrB
MDTKDQKSEKVIRNFWLSTWALNNKNTVYLFTIITIVFGLYSYISLPKELFPDVQFPTVMVQTIYPGNPPVDMENLVTRPLEKEIESVKGIKKMTSSSSQDASSIFVEFQTNVDIKRALQDVKDAVDKARSNLPDDLPNDPMVKDIDLSEFPVINVNLSGDFSINELKNFAEDLKDEYETIYEVSKVMLTGVSEREVKINLDPYKMAALQISYKDVEDAIKFENISISGGSLKMGKIRRSLRVVGEFDDPEKINDIIIKAEKGNIVYLRDIGYVEYGFKDAESYARLNGQPVVTLQVVKKGGENLLSLIDQVFEFTNSARKDNLIPQNLVITYTNDQSDKVRKQLSNLENSIIMGILFVILVLYFFLGTRNSLFVGFAIPMSMFLSFMIMGLMDYRINMVVLFSLILALGMLVDNAIVVTENIYRFVDKGYPLMEAARQAVGEVAVPIISSTATTLAAFFPLLFWKSLMGEFMKYLPETLIITLSSSLFVALVIIPVVFVDFYKKEDLNEKPNAKVTLKSVVILTILGVISYFVKITWLGSLMMIFALLGVINFLLLHKLMVLFRRYFLPWLENTYLKFIRFALYKRNPFYFIIGTFLLMIFTIVFYFENNPKVVFFPKTDPKLINILVEMPISTDVDVTDSTMKILQNDVFNYLKPYDSIVKSVLSITGKGAVGQEADFSGNSGASYKGVITINFVDYKDRGGISTVKIMKGLSDTLIGKYPGVKISLEQQKEGPPAGKEINIEISGKDFKTLLYLADSIRSVINEENIPGIEGLDIDLNPNKPELLVNIDREKARRFGLSTAQVGDALRTSLFGKEVSDYKEGEDEYKIRIKLDDRYRYDLPSLMNQRITFRSRATGKIIQVPISAVATFKYGSTYGSIKRIDRRRVVTVYSNVIKGYNANEINAQIKELLKDFPMPQGYKYSFTGEQQEQKDAMEFLSEALLVALALILIILVSQFNSIVKPAIIMFSVVLSTIGVFGGLATFNMNFVVIMTGIGIVSLAGVVVNNAIVLIDYIGLLKLRKKKEMRLGEKDNLPVNEAIECIVQAGKTRLRPVLLTAITTVLGLMPLATGVNINFLTMLNDFNPDLYWGGDNAAFWGPMSWTVIFGLSFATFLTLIIVPSLYHVLYLGKLQILKWTGKEPVQQTE